MSGIVTSGFTQSEVADLVSELASVYEVSADDVEITLDYVTSGTLDIILPQDLSTEEAVQILQQSVSEALGVHAKDVLIVIEEDGSVSYQVVGDSYEEVAALFTEVSSSDFVSALEELLSSADEGIVLSGVSPSPSVEVVMTGTVDTTDSPVESDPVDEIATLTEQFGLTESTVESFFVTAAPTLVPSVSPITSIPTAIPSVTGIVVSVEVTRVTEAALSEEEVAELVAAVSQSYGADVEDVSAVVEYVTTGTLQVDVGDGVSEAKVSETVTQLLAEALGVPPEDISVTVDAATGEVSYTISTPDFATSESLVESLASPDLVDTLNDMTDVFTVEGVQADDEIVASVTLVVAADEVSVPLQQGENVVTALLGEEYMTTVQGKLHYTLICIFR